MFVINYLSQSFMLVYIPVNQPSVAAIDKKGLRFGMILGITFTTIGLWMKCLINYSFIYVIVGQTIIAIGQPFILNACAKLSGNWFGEKERVYSTSLCANSFVLGISFGYFIPSLFVKDTDLTNKESASTHVF